MPKRNTEKERIILNTTKDVTVTQISGATKILATSMFKRREWISIHSLLNKFHVYSPHTYDTMVTFKDRNFLPSTL